MAAGYNRVALSRSTFKINALDEQGEKPMAGIPINGDFVVYELIDPRDKVPFYVGCGSFARAQSSGSLGSCRGQGAKYEQVRSIRADGLRPRARIIAVYLTKADALDGELEHYRTLLRRGLCLTNKIEPRGSGREPVPDRRPIEERCYFDEYGHEVVRSF